MLLFRDLGSALGAAGRALVANKSRGALTTIGIVMGVLGVITTMTAANGLANSFKESISALGSDVLYVSRMPWVMRGNFFQFRNRPELTLKEARKLEATLSSARAVNPTLSMEKSVRYQSNSLRNIDIIGTTDKHLLVSSAIPEAGRFLTRFDVQYKRPVCVIGHQLRDSLFQKADPLNQTIRIGPQSFRVVGVMEKQGTASFFGGPNFDAQIFVPITTFVRSFGGSRRDINIAVKAPDPAVMKLADYEVELNGEVRKLRGLAPADKDDFSINKMDSLVGAFNQVMGVVVGIGIFITGISLFVGGIGVMNIMFVSVTERTREIGVRKALGARRRLILSQFLLESTTICVAGGVVGLLAAFVATEVIDRMLLPASISPFIVLLAFVVSVSVGVLSGLVPAWRASRLDPVESLRYE